MAGPFELIETDELEPLKPRELAFLHHYLPGCECQPSCQFNAAKSVIAIGLSESRADRTGSEYVRKRRVQAAIARKMMKLELSTDRVLLEIARLSFLDPAALYRSDGITLKNIHDMDPTVRAAIGSIEWNEWGPKVRLHNKTESLRLLAKVMDMVRERVTIEGQFDLSVIAEALKRFQTEAPKGDDTYGPEYYLPGEGPNSGPTPTSDLPKGPEESPPGGAPEAGQGEAGPGGDYTEGELAPGDPG